MQTVIRVAIITAGLASGSIFASCGVRIGRRAVVRTDATRRRCPGLGLPLWDRPGMRPGRNRRQSR